MLTIRTLIGALTTTAGGLSTGHIPPSVQTALILGGTLILAVDHIASKLSAPGGVAKELSAGEKAILKMAEGLIPKDTPTP